MPTPTWPGTRGGLLESIAIAAALAWTATTDEAYMHWDNRRAELEGMAGTITPVEMGTIAEICAEKRRVYEGGR